MERVDGSLKTKARTAWTKDEREEEECRREFNMHGGIFERFCALNSDVCSPINVVVDVVIIIFFSLQSWRTGPLLRAVFRRFVSR